MSKSKKEIEVSVEKDDGEHEIVKIYVVPPTAYTIQRADRYKAKVWTECIEDGIKTKDELEIIMKKRGIWNEAKQKEEEEIVGQIQKLEKELYLGDGKKKVPLSDGKKRAIQMRKLRMDLRNLMMDKMNLEQNTAESLADNARFDYIVAYSTFYENGDNVYENIEDYNNKSSDEIAFSAAAALAEMMYAYDPRNEENLPENQWLKHFNLVDENLSLIDKSDHLVDLEGRKINELGHYINENDERIDVNGNPLDVNGNYVIQVNYQEEGVQSVETKRTRKQKTPVKSES